MSIGWDDDKDGKPIKVLKDQVRILVRSPEQSKNNMLWLKRVITVPPRYAIVAEVTCKDILAGQHIIAANSSLAYENPNLKFESMCYDNPEETKANMLPIILNNLDFIQYIHIPVIAFAKPEEENKVAYAEIAEIKCYKYT